MKKIFLILIATISLISITSCDFDFSDIESLLSGHKHSYILKNVTDDYLAVEASCTEAAKYYYSCECGTKSNKTYNFGDPAGHSYGSYVSENNATETADGTKTRTCSKCGATDSTTDVGSKIVHSHVYNVENHSEQYIKSVATCTTQAVYYKSCSCGLASTTETFSYGNKADHVYSQSVVATNYLKSAATCTSKAIYYKSCTCGACGTETFESGNKLNHTYNVKKSTDTYKKSSTDTETIYYYSCTCGAKGTTTYTVENTTGTGTVKIFEINDTHGAAFTDTESSLIGLDKAQSLLESLETSTTKYIKVANGDLFQGEYVSNKSQGKVFIDVLNAMEFDCFVIGNHEFDWGLSKVAQYKDGDLTNGELNCDFICCNLYEKATNQKPSWLKDYVIVNNNGVKVGIIGAIGQYLESSIATDKVKDYDFVNPVPIIQTLAAKLRTEEGCDCVIVSIHEYSSDTNNALAQLTGNSKIDGIICGHTHQSIQESVERSDNYMIPVIQSYTKNKNVGVMTISVSNHSATSGSTKHYTLTNYEESSTLTSVKSQYQSLITQSHAAVGYTASGFSKQELGILADDAMCEATGATIGIVNQGGVRDTIDSGSIMQADILAVFPFDNKVYVVNVLGSKLKNYLNNNSSALYYNVELSTIKSTTTYKVAIIDYVFNGGNCKSALGNPTPTDTQQMIYDIVSDYIIENYPAN